MSDKQKPCAFIFANPTISYLVGSLAHNEALDAHSKIIAIGNLILPVDEVSKNSSDSTPQYDLQYSRLPKTQRAQEGWTAAENFLNSIYLAKKYKEKYFAIPGENDLQYLFPGIAAFETSSHLKKYSYRINSYMTRADGKPEEEPFEVLTPVVFHQGWLITYGGITKAWMKYAAEELAAYGFGVVPGVTLEKTLKRMFSQRDVKSALYCNTDSVKSPMFAQKADLKDEDLYGGISQMFYSPNLPEKQTHLFTEIKKDNVIDYIARIGRIKNIDKGFTIPG